jgi:hypothetical protein
MITRVYRAIRKHLRTVTVNQHSEAKVDGEYIDTYVSGTKQLAVFPLTLKDLRHDPNGVYTLQDKKFYEIGAGTINPKSTVVMSDGTYTIDLWSDRNFDGGFTMYVGKRNPG